MQNNTVTAAKTESAADYKLQARAGGLFCRTYRIEMQKILKRWDTLLLLLGAAIPLVLSIGLAAHASFLKISVATKIDSAQFLVIITQMVASVCIFHLIAALYAARFYCSEVENNSILLYVPRICNRGIQYCAKFLALLTAVAAAQVIIGMISMLCFYFIVVPSRPDIATAQSISGSQGSALAAMLLAYLFSYLVVIAVVMGIGSYLKMVPSFAVCAVFVFLCQFLPNAPSQALQMLSPWRYISGFSNYVQGIAEKLTRPELLAGSIICCLAYLLVFSAIGYIKFRKKDLG